MLTITFIFIVFIMSDYILSIDIGIHNIGYALYNIEEDKLYFDLYDVDSHLTSADKKCNVVVVRTKYISTFVDNVFSKYNINKVIIERQVNNNTMAMELMYSLTACVYHYCKNIIIFDPKMKFTALGLTYTTKNKAHKKLSINIIYHYIQKYYPHLIEQFDNTEKQDDISDAMLMIFIYLNKGNVEGLMKIKDVIVN